MVAWTDQANVPRSVEHVARTDMPGNYRAIGFGLEFRWESLLDFVLVAIFIALCYNRSIRVSEERLKSCDLGVWLDEEFGDRKGVMQVGGSDEHH